MNTFVRCGSLFTGTEDEALEGGALVFDGEGQLLYVGAEAGAPRRARGDRLIDHSGCFVMPGLIDVHRVMAAGPYLTTHQGLTDWYPTWIGVPETSIGKLVTNLDEAVEEVRRQVKNGVDCIKLALDGIQRRPDGELIAAFTQHETEVIVRETHRMGKKAIAHAVGREATLYAARAGVDLIFHGFDLDEECIAAMLETGSFLCPTLTHPKNLIDFTQPHEAAAQKGRVEQTERRYRLGIANLKKAVAAGVAFLPGTDTGFAITPYGEWHARELELFVADLGFTPAAALRATTEA